MRIRKATQADRTQTVALGRTLHAEGAYAFLPFDEAFATALFEAHTGDPESACLWVGEQDNTLTGFLAGRVDPYVFCREYVAHDTLFYVAPMHRGSGVAQALVVAFRDYARRRGARELCLSVSSGVRARRVGRLYERLGLDFVGGNYMQRLD
jgi:GNAT superfamily N-acetyltransferase